MGDVLVYEYMRWKKPCYSYISYSLCQNLHSFLVAVTTHYHKLSSLQETQIFSLTVVEERVQNHCQCAEIKVQAWLPSLKAEGDLASSTGIPWPMVASLQSLPPSPHHLLYCFCAHLSI